ncbi:MAG TPA: DedA family protein [Thermoanaerobaculia bacterium]|jgi:membrane protein DedA with SNARE-associated domain
MSPEVLLERFGYLAVFLGTFLEGEAILVAAGFFAERGYLDLMMVGIVAFAGAYVGHLFWFWLGRVHGVKLLDRFPRMKQHFGKSIRLFERYGAAAIILTQWLYGLRITCAVLIGMSRIAIVKFLILQAISCAIWAAIVTAAGYYFGRAITALLGRAKHLEKWGLLVIVLVAVGFWLYHRWKDRKEASE